MARWIRTAATTTALALVSACSAAHPAATASTATASFVTYTPKATKDIPQLTWDLFYEPLSIDPAHSANYSENEVIANLCDSLLRLNPDFTISPALATSSNPTPDTWIYNIRKGVTFWDGKPLTAADVAYSLQRNIDPKVGSYFTDYYRNVAKIAQTGPYQVTVTLKRPDVLFNEAMATAAGAVIEKAYAQQEGQALGSPHGGIMCSGPFHFVRWDAGNDLIVARNDHYWDPAHRAHAAQVVFKFISDPSTQVDALLTGQVQGMYQAPLDALSKLSTSTTGKLYYGKSLIQWDFIVNQTHGPLADPRIREALSLALDRTGIAKTIFQGTAVPAQALVTPATWGAGRSAYAGAPPVISATPELAKARQLVKQAGSPTAPITYAYPSGASVVNDQLANVLQQTGREIGLTIKLKPIPRDTYSNIFFDPKMRQGVDLFYTMWYADFPDPLDVYNIFLPNESVYNYLHYSNPLVTSDLDQAWQTANPVQRARLVLPAQRQILHDLPWIPVVDAANLLYMSNSITGAPASFVDLYYPWAAGVGGR
jgi:peptide/nickel transport system substrate-binding protein